MGSAGPPPAAAPHGQTASRASYDTYTSRTTTTTSAYQYAPEPQPTIDEMATMQAVHQAIAEIEREYEDLKRQLDKRSAELKALKDDKAQRRKQLRTGDGTSSQMMELMNELRELQGQVQRTSTQSLDLDEKIDTCKLTTLRIDREEAHLREELSENQRALTAARSQGSELRSKITNTEADLQAISEDLDRWVQNHVQMNSNVPPALPLARRPRTDNVKLEMYRGTPPRMSARKKTIFSVQCFFCGFAFAQDEVGARGCVRRPPGGRRRPVERRARTACGEHGQAADADDGVATAGGGSP